MPLSLHMWECFSIPFLPRNRIAKKKKRGGFVKCKGNPYMRGVSYHIWFLLFFKNNWEATVTKEFCTTLQSWKKLQFAEVSIASS